MQNIVTTEQGDSATVQALVPLSTMIGYAKAVRSLTAGRWVWITKMSGGLKKRWAKGEKLVEHSITDTVFLFLVRASFDLHFSHYDSLTEVQKQTVMGHRA